MQYAVWIAIAVVFIAIIPAILQGLKAQKDDGADKDGTDDNGRD